MKILISPHPLRFRPVLKRTIWGGSRLGELLAKPIGEENDYAESWELVDRDSDQSVVADGPLEGRSLAELVAELPEWFGLEESRRSAGGVAGNADRRRFPLLLKYLDCNRVLSVQVHPDDAYGATMPQPDLGKTEAWYIIDADEESLVYAGLQPGVDRDQLARAVAQGETERVLASFHPEPGDCVFIPAGTVHALGAGLLVAEIQQSSDTTFRLFDWNRLGADAKPRTLHIEQSLEVTDYHSGPVGPRRSNREQSGWQMLVECDKFVLRSLESGGATITDASKFHIVTIPRGRATLRVGGENTVLATGQTTFLPAGLGDVELEVDPSSTLLAMNLPE